MGEMMIHHMYLRWPGAKSLQQPALKTPLLVEGMPEFMLNEWKSFAAQLDCIPDFSLPIFGGANRNSDMINVLGLDTCFGKASGDCPGGEIPGVFLSGETFFFDGKEKLSVLDDTGGGVVEEIIDP